MEKGKKGDKAIKIGTFDSNKHLTPLNVIGFIATVNKFNGLNNVNGTSSSLFQSYADTNVLERSESSTAYATFGKKSGLCNGNMELTPISKLLLDGRIDIHEYELILLTKQWIWLRDRKVHLLKTFYSIFKDKEIVLPKKTSTKVSTEGTDYEEKTEKKKKNFNDYFSASVGPMFSNILDVNENDVTNRLEFFRTALLISRLCIIQDNKFIINPNAIGIWETIANYDFLEPVNDASSEQYYDYLGNTKNGVFEIEEIEQFKELYPKIYDIKYLNDMNHEQKIYYGAPGTGKSNEISELTGKGKGGIKFEKDFTFRVTFHPDSDYSTFVGAYKPTTYKPEGSDEQKITYDFRPQAFIKAYINAWLHYDKPVALVIEEINRGNCAQVFGDIFQLLDRHNDGLSKYPIEADMDMKGYIERAFKGEIKEFGTKQLSEENKPFINNKYQYHYDNAFDKIKKGEILALPMNLSILATMNTSDQSLFPMDSAFKRRWEWVYVPIKNDKMDWKIEVGELDTKDEAGNSKKESKCVDWWKFLEKINKVIFNLTDSEDKQLGYHFIHLEGDEKIIDNKTFVGKVIFYLWNDVFKDYGYEPDCCKSKDKKEKVSFAQFYQNDSSELMVNPEVLKVFFEQLDFEDKDFENLPEIENAENAPAAPENEAGHPENNAEDGSNVNEIGDEQSAESSAESAQDTNNEASNTEAGDAPVNPDETANG